MYTKGTNYMLCYTMCCYRFSPDNAHHIQSIRYACNIVHLICICNYKLVVHVHIFMNNLFSEIPVSATYGF